MGDVKQSQDQAPPGGTRLWLRILLVVSLTLNLLILGAIAGAHLRYGADARLDGPPQSRSAMRDLGFGAFIDSLPRDQRRELGRALRTRMGSFAVNREVLAQEFAAVLAALRAEPFEQTGLLGLLESQSQRVNGRSAVAREVVLERIAAMTPAQRAAYADRLEKALHRSTGDRRR